MSKHHLPLSTGCSLSDQHILSSIIPKYDDWHLLKLFWNQLVQNLSFEFQNNLCKRNSVQEACAKCCAVHILKFEILHKTQNIETHIFGDALHNVVWVRTKFGETLYNYSHFYNKNLELFFENLFCRRRTNYNIEIY